MAGGCALPTSLHAVERGEIRIGDTVLVLDPVLLELTRFYSLA